MMQDLTALAELLVKHCRPVQIDQILQDISDRADNNDGACPLCDEQEYPIDDQGMVVVGDDVSGAAEWVEQHADGCIVTLIEAARVAKV